MPVLSCERTNMTAAEELKHQLHPGKLFINGRWEDAEGGRTIDICNPATGEHLTTVPDGDGADVDRAVAAARASLERKSWRGFSTGETSLTASRCSPSAISWRPSHMISHFFNCKTSTSGFVSSGDMSCRLCRRR